MKAIALLMFSVALTAVGGCKKVLPFQETNHVNEGPYRWYSYPDGNDCGTVFWDSVSPGELESGWIAYYNVDVSMDMKNFVVRMNRAQVHETPKREDAIAWLESRCYVGGGKVSLPAAPKH